MNKETAIMIGGGGAAAAILLLLAMNRRNEEQQAVESPFDTPYVYHYNYPQSRSDATGGVTSTDPNENFNLNISPRRPGLCGCTGSITGSLTSDITETAKALSGNMTSYLANVISGLPSWAKPGPEGQKFADMSASVSQTLRGFT